MAKPPLVLQTTTLWDYPSQHYGDSIQGDPDYAGATPSFVIWNLLSRYTHKGETVVDPMAGSGTTLDVAKDLERKALGFDIAPFRKDIARADARKIPLPGASADFVFIDPPYSTHITYSDEPACIGRLDAGSRDYSRAMEQVIREIDRILKPGRYMALYVSDSFKKGRPFAPIGMELFGLLRKKFTPVDIVCVVRRNAKLKRNHWHTAAIEGNYFLRGFNYLFIMKKRPAGKKFAINDRRDKTEIEQQILARTPAKTPGKKPASPKGRSKKSRAGK
jgi:DNA modification methylase